MSKSATVTAALAAALVFTSAAPAFAKFTTRSAQSLPPAKALVSAKSGSFFASSRSIGTVKAAASVQPSSPLQPSNVLQSGSLVKSNGLAANQSRLGGSGLAAQARFGGGFGGGLGNGGFGGGLATLFGFLPPQIQQIIAGALGNAGPGAGQLCTLLGIPGCQLPDSNG